MMQTETTCKICSSKSLHHLYRKDDFEIVKCNDCQIVFTIIPPDFDLVSIYDETYFQGGQEYGYGNYIGSESTLKKEFSRSVKLLRKLTNNKTGLKLLELGSAYGFFLDEAKNYFDCHGLEVSEEAVNFSIERGHNIINGFYDEENASKIGKVDIVCMFDVIEHLPDPVGVIDLLNKYLNKDGLILITTGDIDSFLAKAMKRKWRLMTPPQHTFFFSKKTLSKIFLNLGYEILIADRPSKIVPLGLAFYQVFKRIGLGTRYLNRFNNISLKVNLFDTVRIVARKI